MLSNPVWFIVFVIFYLLLFVMQTLPQDKPKRLGGVGLPNAQLYYHAAILDQMRYWFSCQTDKWSGIERKITSGHDLPAQAIAASLNYKPITPFYPTVQATLTVWSFMTHQKFADTPMYKLKTLVAAYEHLIPNILTQSWKKEGMNFSLPEMDKLEVLDKYQLFQIKHYIPSNTARPINIPQMLWDYLISKHPWKHKGISLFYKFATPLFMHTKLPNM